MSDQTPAWRSEPLSVRGCRAFIAHERESVKDRLNDPDTWRSDADCVLEIAPLIVDGVERLRAELANRVDEGIGLAQRIGRLQAAVNAACDAIDEIVGYPTATAAEIRKSVAS